MLVIKPELRNAIIRVEGVTQFSFGSRDNSADTGHVCMWGGESRHGWFEINPAARYEAAYSKSTEAVNIYYFMQSLYKLKAAASLKIEEVLYRVSLATRQATLWFLLRGLLVCRTRRFRPVSARS